MAAPAAHRFEAIDSLRGLCACLVALYHFRNNASPIAQSVFIDMSWQFVDLFFVISGYVMALNYRTRLESGMPVKRFLELRLGRIYPLHLFVLAAFVVMEVVIYLLAERGIRFREAFDAEHDPVELIKQLLFIDGIADIQKAGWNYPTWSIATEFWTYILFALAVVRFGPALEKCLLVVIAVCPLVLLAVSPRGIQAIADWGLIRCIYGFAMGVLCCSLWQRWGPALMAQRRGWSAIELATVAAVLAFVPLAGGTLWNLFAPLLFGATVIVFSRQGGVVSRLLMMRIPLFLGSLSYSIYMVHVFVQQRIGNAVMLIAKSGGPVLTSSVVTATGEVQRINGANALQGTVMMVIMLALVVVTAWITYNLVERPGQRWARAMFDPGVRHART